VELTFRRVTEDDFDLLAGWLAEPGVRRWWCHDPTPEAVARDFGPAARGEEPCEDLLVLLDGEPVGLLQRCRFDDYPEDRAEVARLAPVPPGTVQLDYLLGPPELRGRGVGTAMVRAAVADTWAADPDTPAVMVAVVAANVASWRALEKAGLRRVAEGDIDPDNPVDDPLHYVYRLDRPPSGSPR
jgi:aminoglycoside 6'-N-acetyltransferase